MLAPIISDEPSPQKILHKISYSAEGKKEEELTSYADFIVIRTSLYQACRFSLSLHRTSLYLRNYFLSHIVNGGVSEVRKANINV